MQLLESRKILIACMVAVIVSSFDGLAPVEAQTKATETVALDIAEEIVAQFEGYRSCPYDDRNPRRALKPADKVEGVLTVGFGRTGPGVKIGVCVKEEDERRWLRAKLQEIMAEIDSKVDRSMTPRQLAAWGSFSYNLGPAYAGYRAFKAFQVGDDATSCRLLLQVNTDDGVVLPGLTDRREREVGMICPQVAEAVQ